MNRRVENERKAWMTFRFLACVRDSYDNGDHQDRKDGETSRSGGREKMNLLKVL